MITVGGGTQAYFYDAFGRQSQTIYAGNTYSMIFGLNGRIEIEFSGNSWSVGELYAGSVGPYLGNYSKNTTYFAHNDQVGTRRKYTDVSGNIVDTCIGLPFGDGSSCSGSAPPNSITAFTGQDWDPNTNLTRFPARDYSMQQGRWLSPDPAGLGAVNPANPQTWNRYAYVANNPESFFDPLGLFKCAVDPDTGGVLRGQLCNTNGDPYFGGGNDGGYGTSYSFDFDLSMQDGPCSDFMPCGINYPTLGQSIWSDLLGLPSGLNCPQVGGISNLLCGGVSPGMDAQNNGQQNPLTPCAPGASNTYFNAVQKANNDYDFKNATVVSVGTGACLYTLFTGPGSLVGCGGAALTMGINWGWTYYQRGYQISVARAQFIQTVKEQCGFDPVL